MKLRFLSLLILLTGMASGQVVFDNKNSGGATTAATLSFNITIGAGSNRAAMACLAVATKATTATVTLGGTSMNILSPTGGVGNACTTGSNNSAVYCYSLANPASGVQAVVFTPSGSVTMVGGAVSVTGADQTTPVNNPICNTSAAAVTPQTVTPTSNSGDLAFDAVEIESGAACGTASNNQQWSIRQAFAVGGCSQTGAGAGTAALTWTGVTASYDDFGANFQQSSGGSTAAITAAPKTTFFPKTTTF